MSKPVELQLFEFLEIDEKQYSNTIELYDAIPKYHWGNVKRIGEKYLPSLERVFEHRSKRYRVKVRPSRIDGRDGVERDYYPSLREEIVEDALRKLACEGQGIFLDQQAGVTFSLYQLRKELQRMGHGYNLSDIKDALLVCANTKIEVESEDGEAIVVSSLFQIVGLTKRSDWIQHGKNAKAYVMFNPLVTFSIINNNFRQINYLKCMSYKKNLSRWIHKRMSHNYIQASLINNYTILLSTIIRDSCMKSYKETRNNVSQVEEALEEIKKSDVILDYKTERIYGERRNKIIDAKFMLSPSPEFVSEMKRANRRHQKSATLPVQEPLFLRG
jgi:hypothetical protein